MHLGFQILRQVRAVSLKESQKNPLDVFIIGI